MNIFDAELISFINQFSHLSRIVDLAFVQFANNNLIKGGVVVTTFWWLWFRGKQSHLLECKYVISTLVSCVIAIAIARVLALSLPFRTRPLHEESLDFILPHGIYRNSLQDWSAFPSDHAALFFALSTGMLFISKKIGIAALLYTLVFIMFPRVFLGLHYPTDIIFGAIIGISVAYIGNILLIKTATMQTILDWSDSKPAYFYPLFFIASYELANLFEGSRSILSFIYDALTTLTRVLM